MKSRESLTRMMHAKLESFHIEDELTFKQHGDIWENEQHRLQAMTNSEYERYKSLKYAVKRDGLKLVIERAAYIWFNRIVAIRYMEVNNILPLGKNHESLDINVLCDKSGDFRNPEILTISKLRSTDLKVDYNRINSLNNQDKYKEILLEVVKKIGEAIPDVFSGDTENIDALIPDGLLMPNGLIDNILKLGTDQFKHTEIVGWLYQYYNQSEKDRAMKLKTPTAKDDIPYVTQIFTPDWVVKYLVENSLGRYWLDRHPNEELEAKWKYLVKKKEKTEVIRDGRRIEDITFIDPCSGSGHILIYAFEVFYQIYESEGYPKSDIPQLILNNNLYGLDIDDRANQLSILACTLVARKYDDKLFSKNIKQHILSIRESNKINLSAFDPKGEARDVLDYLLDSFYNAKEYGSILKIKNMNYDSLRKAIEDDQVAINLKLDKDLEPLIAQAEILSTKFTIAVTNPPYMNKYNAKLKSYLTYLQGLLNTKALLEVSRVVSNSLNNNVGEIANYPIIKSNDNKNEVIELVNECRNLSKDDWDDYETSWNFETHPLFAHKTETNRLSDAFSVYNKHCEERFARLKSNEERLNKIAIDLYNLNEEMAPDISDDRITVRKANREREARSFLSFFIGCVMGRYNYTKNGVQYAGVGTDMPKNNIVDDDGIITILDKEFFGRDDVINKLRKFLSESFGEKTLSENLDWIAGGLGRKDNERSEDVIRKYFVEEFFNNHAHMIYADPTKRSDGRPIYWEISSGKHNAFKALFYIHRYTPDLIAKVRMDYLIPVLQIYERRRAEIEIQLKTTIGTVEYNRLNNDLADLQNKIEELTKFDQVLKNVADQKIELDLDDGVKANYPKLSLAASEVKKNAQILEAIK